MKKIDIPFSTLIRNFSTLKQYFIQYRLALILGFTGLVLVDIFQLLIPLVIRKSIDLLTKHAASSRSLVYSGFMIIGIALAMAVFRYLWRYYILGFSRKVEELLRARIYEHLQTLSMSFYIRMSTGDLMARAINDITAVRMAVGMGLVALFDGMVLGTAAIGFMFSISFKLTLIALIPAPCLLIFSKILIKRMSAGFAGAQKTFAGLTETVREFYSGIRVVRAYNREDWTYGRLKHEGSKYISANMELAKIRAMLFPMMAVFTSLGLVIVLWAGGRLTILNHITTGDFVAFTIYFNLLSWPVMAMGWVTNLFQRGSASMERINGILKEKPEIFDSNVLHDVNKIKGEIVIENLSFIYPGTEKTGISMIDLKIFPGETIALVGRVGSGKTTLLNIIPRLLEQHEGTIYIDGYDSRKIPLNVLRKNIGFVPQDVFVFSDTIRQNILFGIDNVSGDKLNLALEAASFIDDVNAMDKGFDTMLGERGITLSGGQRQRLTIARALVIDPPILIMDDALSMVDTHTEEKILSEIIKLRAGKTTLIVSHRLSTISRSDKIFVLDQGKLVETGSHEDLLKAEGLYSEIYKRQLLARELNNGADVDVW